MIASAFTVTIVRAVRSIMFLQNVVYLSMLECSDADGSATAVMAYLDVMLSVVDDRSVLVDVVVGYLVGAAEGEHILLVTSLTCAMSITNSSRLFVVVVVGWVAPDEGGLVVILGRGSRNGRSALTVRGAPPDCQQDRSSGAEASPSVLRGEGRFEKV
ncbi:hypothetical protein A4X06_0g4963 [Tilletia controversa]|uniref:Uncharacterized protein n=2 Tax=Tilletia TaxID=13289 RepID=A0A8X7MSV4_9BASI|nr:hypothetical protein CF336_g5643 [Tilletia laevis]KAE8195352.1 hypothetical protein CF328_g4465 [Tilletia controversa]KAE8195979.1 hypothetical protein CF335_g4965 [Tilletia laevis]KAE8246570.1 hypothetical protein A4X06_0g4963 [Tilletia controversa]KAE8256846.1 hypothetical protein A4X03_0g4997 [Tilletia caries]